MALVRQPLAMPGTTFRKTNVLLNDTNFFLTQLYLGLKAEINHYLQKLLMTGKKELEVASNNTTITQTIQNKMTEERRS